MQLGRVVVEKNGALEFIRSFLPALLLFVEQGPAHVLVGGRVDRAGGYLAATQQFRDGWPLRGARAKKRGHQAEKQEFVEKRRHSIKLPQTARPDPRWQDG